MKEDFIHFLWKYRLFLPIELKTTDGDDLQILDTGLENADAGPDFSAAKVKIAGTLWAGNVEMHINSSDWYRHNHQNDDAYSNIILHVVMHHDQPITNGQGNEIPVFEVRRYFNAELLGRYEQILRSRSWIPCARFLPHTDGFIVMNWLGRLLVERLENKSAEILRFYKYFENNWEQTFYYFLARNFGFKINASPFALLAQQTPYKILARHKNDLLQLEALLFGQAGFLSGSFADAYPSLLQKEYTFLRHKYQLQPMDRALWKLGKLRPPNFPTIRIAQFAKLIHQSSGLFSQVMQHSKLKEVEALFHIQCSPYWHNHFQFDKSSGFRQKNLGKDALVNIIINTIVPMQFVYGSESLKPHIREQAVQLLNDLPAEHNSIVKNWEKHGILAQNAGESQALLELKKYYCTPKKCLSCAIGHHILRS